MTWKGQLFFEDKAEPEPRALPGSLVAFTRNGELQGVAYRRAIITSVSSTCVLPWFDFADPCPSIYLEESTPLAGRRDVPG